MESNPSSVEQECSSQVKLSSVENDLSGIKMTIQKWRDEDEDQIAHLYQRRLEMKSILSKIDNQLEQFESTLNTSEEKLTVADKEIDKQSPATRHPFLMSKPATAEVSREAVEILTNSSKFVRHVTMEFNHRTTSPPSSPCGTNETVSTPPILAGTPNISSPSPELMINHVSSFSSSPTQTHNYYNANQITSLDLETRQSIDMHCQLTWLRNSGSEYRQRQNNLKQQMELEIKKMEQTFDNDMHDIPNDIKQKIRQQLYIPGVTGTIKSDFNRVETLDTVSDDIEDDPDIQVWSESTISPKNNQYEDISRELETRQSIARQSTWTTDSGLEYRERQKQLKEKIRLELMKMETLKDKLDLPIDIQDRIRKDLTIVLEPENFPITLPPITQEMRKMINDAVTGRDDDVIVTPFNIQITRGDLRTLAPGKWINDNVINTYMEMIALRSKEGNLKLPNVHVFSTFFYPKLLKENHSTGLKRWTSKVDIFMMDLVIFPIHLGIHWCLGVADLRNKSIKVYDSLLGQQTRCLEYLFAYISSEMKSKKKMELNRSEWSMELMKDIPTQENESDCGIFACKFAEYLSRDAKLTFKQKDMNYYRDRMVYELLKQELQCP